MHALIIFLFLNTNWSVLPNAEYHKIPTRLKVQRAYHLAPGDRTMRGIVTRDFPGMGLRPLRPRPNFPNGYQKIGESLYNNYLKLRNMNRSVAHQSRKHLRKKLPNRPGSLRLKYAPSVQSHSRSRTADSPFY